MVDQLQFGQKNDPNLAPAAPYLHGPNGLLNIPGTDQKVISALSLPITGALANIPVVNGSLASNGEFAGEDLDYVNIFTGVTQGDAETWANQPTTACADGPYGGLKKICSVAIPYAHYKFGTREVDIMRAGRHVDLADQNFTVLNNPPVNGGSLISGLFPSLQQALTLEIQDRIFETMVGMIRFLARQVWTGSPANNSGVAKQLWGFDSQINTSTHRDHLSSALCTAADSDVKDFGYSLITGNVRDIVRYIEMCDAYVMFNAEQQGLTPYVYDIYMHPNMWQTISEIWPIRQYQAAMNQMALFTNGRVTVDGNGANALRDSFRSAMILPVNGRNIRVVLDSGITELTPNENANLQPGQWASTIYGIPKTVMGGYPATFFKAANHNNAQENAIAAFVASQANGGMTFTSDGGLMRWYSNFKNGCLKLNYEFDPKLFVITPQLAWRIDNVAYAPLQHLRSAFPTSDYFFDGGATNGPATKYYGGWQAGQVTLS